MLEYLLWNQSQELIFCLNNIILAKNYINRSDSNVVKSPMWSRRDSPKHKPTTTFPQVNTSQYYGVIDESFWGSNATIYKVSALENVVNPRIENTITFIKWELHELEREDLFKLKHSYSYKKREFEMQMKSSKNFADKQDLETFSL